MTKDLYTLILGRRVFCETAHPLKMDSIMQLTLPHEYRFVYIDCRGHILQKASPQMDGFIEEPVLNDYRVIYTDFRGGIS